MQPQSQQEAMQYAKALAAVVKAGLGATQTSGIQDIMKSIATEIGAFGCVLWEASPGTILTKEKMEGGFFGLAEWFADGSVWSQHDIPVQSATGFAIADGRLSYVSNDIPGDPHCYKAKFLEDHDLTRVGVFTLKFADGVLGALALFRKRTDSPFADVEELRARQMTDLLPALYETIRDEVAYRCSTAVNTLLQEASRETQQESRDDALRTLTQEFCTLLKDNLHCFDVSVYLEEDDEPDTYKLYGTTLSDRSITTESYRRGDMGPTAAAITHGTPIRIPDLRLRSSYPTGIAPANQKYVDYVGQQLGARPMDVRPTSPLSFIASPILVGERVLGVLRCCVPIQGPTYFASREADLVMLLAGQIGQFVSDQRSRREVDRERQAYRVIIDSITSLTELVYGELGKEKPNEDAVIDKGVEAIGQALAGEQWISVGVRSGPGAYQRRETGSPSPGVQPKATLELPSAWEKELTAGQGILVTQGQLSAEASRLYVESLPARPTAVLLAPIRSRDQFWILEIVNRLPDKFPKHAISIATLLGKQLGIYHDLLTTILQLKEMQRTLQDKVVREAELARAHAQAMMDLEHQIRAPLRHARTRIPGLWKIALPLSSDTLMKQIQYLRGNLTRAGKVAGNARLFSRLASGQPIELNLISLSFEEIRLLLIEAAMDNTLVADELRGVTFGVEEEGFMRIPKEGKVRLAKGLFDQVLNDLLDNAAKYSDERSHVRIEVSQSKAYFAVAVTNRGLRIARDQIHIIKKRGERGAVAKLAAGEGSGIGLWIADEIMKAHGGILEITATTPERMTRIRLLFPLAGN